MPTRFASAVDRTASGVGAAKSEPKPESSDVAAYVYPSS